MLVLGNASCTLAPVAMCDTHVHLSQLTRELQVTHMPHLEEAIMSSIQNGNGNGNDSDSNEEGPPSREGSPQSNGADRPSSPSRPSSSGRQRRAAELELEHSMEGASPTKTPHASGLAGKAAQIFGNEAHQSTDLL